MAHTIVMLAYPGMTQLDLTGPFEVLARLPEAKVHLAWKSTRAITDAAGLTLEPTTKFGHLDRCDVLFVPGGPGQVKLMADDTVLTFLRYMAQEARIIGSVSTGALLLGAAGLLKGHRAACHWLSADQLPLLGAEPTRARVVRDGNRVTGAGSSAGLDVALEIVSELAGSDEAGRIALALEYEAYLAAMDGAVRQRLEAEIRARTDEFQRTREAAAREAGARLPA
ncbi:DJ-1/PfpI family protein [Aquabacter sp. L1I39]|uniref:DJ-1/PfpI family protein n=1 Tax=Aquabacter sp. L1I39 TaxID=2820278 RepID=UPI001ADB7310|nr:DJ-1/PfpI family protein [Aquabacter sp. L1I39]QTL03210.1 DJ-1/PfpI family protein [Aquabacter sp. L1I39]